MVPMPSDMTGRAALVTGAAAGLGRATALRLARAGADVCSVDINVDRLGGDGERSGLAWGQDAWFERSTWESLKIAAPRSPPPSMRSAASTRCATFGGGLRFRVTTSQSSRKPDFEKTLAVNLSAPFFLIQAAISHCWKRTEPWSMSRPARPTKRRPRGPPIAPPKRVSRI